VNGSAVAPRARRDALSRAAHAARIAGVLGLLVLAGCARAERRPNLVLVTLDTTRADALSCYGAPQGSTPNLDALARSGTRFDLAVATAALTPVSHASILTGLHNQEHGLRVLAAPGGYRLPADVPTLATVLADEGYATAAFHSAFPVSAHFGLERGFEVFESFELEGEGADAASWDVDRLQRRSDATTDLALDFLERVREPYFLWVHYWDPHDALRIPPLETLPSDLPQRDGKLGPSRELYAAEVRYLDQQIGRLLAAVDAGRSADDTLVLVVSDHGEGLGDHGWAFHRILYQEQIRVPLIVRAPNRGGARVQRAVPDVVSTVDLFATALDYLGLERALPPHSRSLRGLIEGRAEEPRLAFADSIAGYDLAVGATGKRMSDSRPLDDFLYCALDREWKLIYRPAHPEESELYHIASDPRELRNRFGVEPEQTARLLIALAEAEPWVTAPFASAAADPALEASRGALAALGYAGDGEAVGPTAEDWEWVCPRHADARSSAPSACAVCGGRPVPVARGR
jgi:arylsulfatase A-like enzyme